ncbi:MAG: mechanosensitive ion channel [Saprospiraceae bacterium]
MDFNQFFEQLYGETTNGWALQILYFIIWCAFILFLLWLANKAANRYIEDAASRYRTRKVVRFTGYVLIVLLAIVTFTGNIQYFGISIGLFTAGVAFALQEVILSVAGWISIAANNLYKPGDRIELNGVKGDVIDVGITKTTLMEIGVWVASDNYTGRIVQLSNGFVFKMPVYNYSRDFPFLWDEINLPVRYGSDVEMTTAILKKAAGEVVGEYVEFAKTHWKGMVRKYLIEDAQVAPAISLRLTDNWMEFNLRYVVDFKQRRATKNELFRLIQKEVEETKGKVSLASATIELVGLPDVRFVNARRDADGK